jgi:hypothetical protein
MLCAAPVQATGPSAVSTPPRRPQAWPVTIAESQARPLEHDGDARCKQQPPRGHPARISACATRANTPPTAVVGMCECTSFFLSS